MQKIVKTKLVSSAGVDSVHRVCKDDYSKLVLGCCTSVFIVIKVGQKKTHQLSPYHMSNVTLCFCVVFELFLVMNSLK